MPDSTLTLLSFRVPIYSLAVALGIAFSLGIALWRTSYRSSYLVDACLGICLGGILGARLEHVLLNWAYFADNFSEALRPNAGGLGWHGALLGGLFGLALAARWRRLNFRLLLDALTPALPLLAFAAWLGCWAAVCAFGAEVDTLAHYPAFAAAETRDVYGIVAPRYNTQIFGMALAFVLFLLSIILIRRKWLPNRRFWLLLALLSLGMFVIGFFRADFSPIVAALRADQWLDITFALWGIALTIYNGKRM